MDMLKKSLIPLIVIILIVAIAGTLLRRPPRIIEPTSNSSITEDLEIVTLLPKDAIPSIDNPTFLDAVAANQEYAPEELVLGVDFDGVQRAYSTALLSRHEIVNDEINGNPFAVTW